MRVCVAGGTVPLQTQERTGQVFAGRDQPIGLRDIFLPVTVSAQQVQMPSLVREPGFRVVEPFYPLAAPVDQIDVGL